MEDRCQTHMKVNIRSDINCIIVFIYSLIINFTLKMRVHVFTNTSVIIIILFLYIIIIIFIIIIINDHHTLSYTFKKIPKLYILFFYKNILIKPISYYLIYRSIKLVRHEM